MRRRRGFAEEGHLNGQPPGGFVDGTKLASVEEDDSFDDRQAKSSTGGFTFALIGKTVERFENIYKLVCGHPGAMISNHDQRFSGRVVGIRAEVHFDGSPLPRESDGIAQHIFNRASNETRVSQYHQVGSLHNFNVAASLLKLKLGVFRDIGNEL